MSKSTDTNIINRGNARVRAQALRICRAGLLTAVNCNTPAGLDFPSSLKKQNNYFATENLSLVFGSSVFNFEHGIGGLFALKKPSEILL